jgi:hypothetical protein
VEAEVRNVSTTHQPQAILRHALHRLAEDARREAATIPMDAAEHRFYVGVATAAEDRLHPERRDVHADAWLDREAADFRDGYLRASALFAAAVDRPPVRFVVPAPQRHGRV